MRKRRPSVSLLIATALATSALLVGALPAAADAPPGPYFNGFETDTAGWFNNSGARLTRVRFGLEWQRLCKRRCSATGNYYARLGIDPSPDTLHRRWRNGRRFYEARTRTLVATARSSRLGGYTTGVDIYLDVPYALTHSGHAVRLVVRDQRRRRGDHRRDFVFNVGTDALGFVITGGNNATRCGANPADLGHAPVHVSLSGWYTFKHTFSGLPGGPLVVTLEVMTNKTNARHVGTWVRADPSDIIGVTVGGNRYGWFVQNEFDGPRDRQQLPHGHPEHAGLRDQDQQRRLDRRRQWRPGDLRWQCQSFVERGGVGPAGIPGPRPLQALNFKATTVTAVICSDDRTSAEIYGDGHREWRRLDTNIGSR